jgi:serine protease Do
MGIAPDNRVTVSDIHPDGPMLLAGLQKGDIITHINARKIRNASELRQTEMRLVPGEKATLAILRVNPPEQITFEFIVGSIARMSSAKPADFPWRGMRLSDIDDDTRKEFGIPVRIGVAVIGVARNSSGFRAGLRVGDVITEVNNTPVATLADFTDAVENIPASNVVRIRTAEGVGHVQGETKQQ